LEQAWFSDLDRMNAAEDFADERMAQYGAGEIDWDTYFEANDDVQAARAAEREARREFRDAGCHT